MSGTGIPVRIEIVRILEAGVCPEGLGVGRKWEVSDSALPDGMCSWAWNSIQPFVVALRCGGAFPWSGEREVEVTCPDAANPVVFKVEAIE